MISMKPLKKAHRVCLTDFIDDPEFEATLICPSCGCDHLHQSLAEVFFREQDAETGESYSISKKGTTQIPMKGNPSSRRDGIRIRFFCEECDDETLLEIIQHKGCTFMKLFCESILEDP